MSGTSIGAKKAAATSRQRYGLNYFELKGRRGGKTRHSDEPRGFAAMTPEQRSDAGRKGGVTKRSNRANS